MGIFLVVVGGLWAVIGIGNLIGMPWTTMETTMASIGLVVNMVLFIIPGLILAGLGVMIENKKKKKIE